MSESLAVNSIISHYRIVSKIGAGGMGEVISRRIPNWIAKLRSSFCQKAWWQMSKQENVLLEKRGQQPG